MTKNYMYYVNGVKFTHREYRLIDNCVNYTESDPAGFPGHNLIILIGKLDNALNIQHELRKHRSIIDIENKENS